MASNSAGGEKRETSRGVRYDVRYRAPSGAVRTRTFRRRKDAETHKSLVEADLLRGEWCDPRLGRVAFSEWRERWRATTVNLRPSTRARDDSYLRSLVLPTFAECTLAEIDRLAIREWVAELSVTHAPATVVKAHQILSKIMGAAVDDGMLPSNPCDRMPLPRSVSEVLTAHLRDLGAAADELVFPAPEGGPVHLSLWRRRFWAPPVRSAGLEPLRVHDMRHTAVALWIAAGASPNEIASRAGHTSVAVVLDRYGHLLPGTEERANDALEALARGLTDSARAIHARWNGTSA